MRNESIRKIINVDKNNYSPIWTFKQEDDAVIKLALFKDSTLLDITGQTIKLCAKRPNNSIVELSDGFVINNNELDITLKNNILAVPGIVECDLEIVDAVGKMTTASFYLTVSKKMTGEENLKATNDISAINKIVAEVEAKALKLDTDIKSLVIEANQKIMQIDSAANIKLEEIQADYAAIKQVVNDDEEIRKSNENIRVNNESNRVKAESLRVTAETTRKENETNRVLAEEKRVLEFNKIKEENSNFKEETTANYNNFVQEVDKQILNSKTDYFGKEHPSVEERLNNDFDNLHQRMNDSSLLQYEGTSIKADNSYYGLTKDMVVKGRTLQNLIPIDLFTNLTYWKNVGSTFTLENGYVSLSSLNDGNYQNAFAQGKDMFKPSTIYTLIVDIKENTLDNVFYLASDNTSTANNSTIFDVSVITINGGEKGIFKYKLTTKSDITYPNLILRSFLGMENTTGLIKYRFMFLEGDHTNTPIEELPYIEGIKFTGENEKTEDGKYKISGKSCGKNLFDINAEAYTSRPYTVSRVINGDLITISSTTPTDWDSYNIKVNGLKYNTYYIISFERVDYPLDKTYVSLYEKKTNTKIGNTNTNFKISETIDLDDIYIRIHLNSIATSYTTCTIKNIQLEEGTVVTDCEQYQESTYSYILSEPLRSLPNGVADTIEGNKVIRRVGKVVTSVDTLIDKKIHSTRTNTVSFTFKLEKKKKYGLVNVMCDKLPTIERLWTQDVLEGIGGSGSSDIIIITLLQSKLSSVDIAGINGWLQNNPLTIYYELAEPIIEELDETLQLKSFNGTTHIISDNYLMPTVSAKIPSDVQAVVSSLINENDELNNTIALMSLENEEKNLENIETNLDQEVRLTMLELGVI